MVMGETGVTAAQESMWLAQALAPAEQPATVVTLRNVDGDLGVLLPSELPVGRDGGRRSVSESPPNAWMPPPVSKQVTTSEPRSSACC
jgi:hypothetical protein